MCQLRLRFLLRFFGPFALSDVCGNAADCVRLIRVIAQQKFHDDIKTGASVRRHNFFKLCRCTGFDYSPVICSQCFRDIMRMNFEIGSSSDLIALNVKKAFILAVNQKVAEFKVLYENDCSRVVDDRQQALLTRAKCLLRSLAIRDIADDPGEEVHAITDLLTKRDFDREFSAALVQAGEVDTSPTDVSLACGDISPQRGKMNLPETFGHERR